MFESDFSSEQQKSAVQAAEKLCDCGECGGSLVQPIDWEERGSHYWKVLLQCPNCWEISTETIPDEVVDEYDLVLERGAALMARSLHDMVEDQIEDEVRRLHDALESELLLPEDF